MHRNRRSEFTRSFLLPLALTVWLSACHKWVELESPQIALEEQADRPVQARDELRLLTEPEGISFEGNPIVIGPDSVVLAKGESRVSVPTQSIARVEARKSDAAGTAGLSAGVVVGLSLGVVLLMAAALVSGLE
jgi:hypothetical protein